MAGVVAGVLGDYPTARAQLSEGLSVSRELRSWSRCGYALLQLAALARIEGSHEQSRVFVEEALAIARDIGARWLNGWGLLCSGWLARAEGDNEHATALTTAALEVLRQLRAAVAARGIVQCVRNLGILAIEAGRLQRGARILGASDRMGNVYRVYERLHDDPRAFQTSKTTAQAVLGDREFEIAWAEGKAMTLEQAVAYALAESDTGVILRSSPEDNRTFGVGPARNAAVVDSERKG
jgi:hypothetical protein